MHKIRTQLLAVAAVIAFTGAAYAADMPVKSAPMAPAAPVATWNGFYIGLNLGAEWIDGGNFNWTPADAATHAFWDPVIAAGGVNLNPGGGKNNLGMEGGIQVGYNWQTGVWLLGVEADFQGAGAEQHGIDVHGPVPGFAGSTIETDTQVDWFGTVRGRAGWLWTPNLLLYGTGGWAYGKVERQIGFTFQTAGGAAALQNWGGSSIHTTTDGWTAGGGLEYLIPGTRVTIGAEYLFVRFEGQNFTATGGSSCAPGAVPSCQFNVHTGNVDMNIVRAKLNVLF
jgi:outer membrane immunogenic protein